MLSWTMSWRASSGEGSDALAFERRLRFISIDKIHAYFMLNCIHQPVSDGLSLTIALARRQRPVVV